jgi:mRNA interferase RelE/StbE
LVWRIEISPRAEREIKMLDPRVQKRIVRFLERRVAVDPYRIAETLSGSFKGYWRFRIGDYRIICEFRKEQMIVWVIQVGHRREVYRR